MEAERKFTLRISDEETIVLNRLKKVLGEKTDTAVIKKIIHQYEDLNNRYIKLSGEYNTLKSSYNIKIRKIDTFLDALNQLKEE